MSLSLQMFNIEFQNEKKSYMFIITILVFCSHLLIHLMYDNEDWIRTGRGFC